MPAGQEIAFEPALTLVLAQHLHDAAVRREVVVVRHRLCGPGAVRHLEHILPAVGVVLVRTEQAEVARASGFPVSSRRADSPPSPASPRQSPRLANRPRPRRRGSPAACVSRRSEPPFVCGLALIRRAPDGASSASSGFRRPVASNSSSGRYFFIQASRMRTCSGWPRISAIGT